MRKIHQNQKKSHTTYLDLEQQNLVLLWPSVAKSVSLLTAMSSSWDHQSPPTNLPLVSIKKTKKQKQIRYFYCVTKMILIINEGRK
jgi:hypothetical protein